MGGTQPAKADGRSRRLQALVRCKPLSDGLVSMNTSTCCVRYAAAVILAVAGAAYAQSGSSGAGQATSTSSGQTYPVKAVRMVVPFAPGGGTDVIARHLATGMSESLKRQVVVDNRGGANGIIGTEIVARAAADGHTLLFVSSPHSVNPSLYAKLPYDTLRDFAPVSLVATSPYILVIHPSLPVRNVKELIALAKSRPDQIDYGSGGSGSSAHLAAELFNQMAGVKLREIPYKGAGPALMAVLSGESAVVFGNALTVKPHIQSGRLRALGIASARRSASAPEIPTIAESGVPDFRAD